VLADVVRQTGAGCDRCWSISPPPPRCASSPKPTRTSSGTESPRRNQLRAHLQIVFPGAVGLFRRPQQPDQPAVPGALPHPERAAWLSVKRLHAWLSSVGYCGRTPTDTLRLIGAPAGVTGPAAEAAAAFVVTLRAITTQIDTLATRAAEHLDLHPDQAIFTSLPRSGRVRAARLLAEIGDARGPAFPAVAHPVPSRLRRPALRLLSALVMSDAPIRPFADRPAVVSLRTGLHRADRFGRAEAARRRRVLQDRTGRAPWRTRYTDSSGYCG
jgi:transposase